MERPSRAPYRGSMNRAQLSEQDREALDWLRRQPHLARIAWGTHHLSLKEPFTHGWVDVTVPELMEAVGWSWVWTVEDPDDPEPGLDVFSFPLRYDAMLEMRYAGGVYPGLALEARLVCQDGRALPLDWLLDKEPCRAPGRWETRDDGRWMIWPMWTPAGISRGIERWLRRHAVRADLRVYWDPRLPGSPVVEAIAELLREAGEGEEATQELALPETVVELMVADDPDIRAGW